MKNLSSFLKRTTLLSLISLSGCISLGKAPAAPTATLAACRRRLRAEQPQQLRRRFVSGNERPVGEDQANALPA